MTFKELERHYYLTHENNPPYELYDMMEIETTRVGRFISRDDQVPDWILEKFGLLEKQEGDCNDCLYFIATVIGHGIDQETVFYCNNRKSNFYTDLVEGWNTCDAWEKERGKEDDRKEGTEASV